LLVGIGLNYRKMEHLETAVDYLQQALEISKYIENRKEQIHIRVDLAEIFLKLQKKDLAMEQVGQAEKDLNFIRALWTDSLRRRIETLRNL